MIEKTRVLIVDDDILFTSSLSDVLTEKGFDTIAINSGEEALAKVKEIAFDVILMDMKMPVMDGLETFKRIKKISPQAAVIMMTAFSMEDLIRNALKEGAYGIVYKPLDIDKVIKMIKAAKEDSALVMVVDDNPNTVEGLKDILEEQGYVVTVAKDSEEAVCLAKEIAYGIIFIDMKLPTLNGLETYLTIRKINPRIIAVMITAYREEMNNLVEQAIKEGAYSVLYKPFDPKELSVIIERVFKEKQKVT